MFIDLEVPKGRKVRSKYVLYMALGASLCLLMSVEHRVPATQSVAGLGNK